MGYSRGTSNYPERITLSDPTYMMSVVDPVAIGVEETEEGRGLKRVWAARERERERERERVNRGRENMRERER